METTERRLRLEDLAGCVALSRSANWNQNEADWRLMLELGHGWGVFAPDGTLAASTLVLPYGGRFAWVSMVLVLPAQRRKGYATKLLRVALDDLRRRGLTPMLDATPAGREVYLQEGFRDTWGFSRLRSSSSAPGEAAPGVRSLAAADWPSVLALDAPAFGASREPLLRVLAARLPAAALVAERAGRMVGYLLGRDGREAHQLGPLIAVDQKAACALLTAALARVAPPLYVDVVDHAPGLRQWLEARGFVLQRTFTRMVHGAHPAPGDQRRLFLVAGPELG